MSNPELERASRALQLSKLATAYALETIPDAEIATHLRQLAAELAPVEAEEWQPRNRWAYPPTMGRGPVIEKGDEVYERKRKVNQSIQD